MFENYIYSLKSFLLLVEVEYRTNLLLDSYESFEEFCLVFELKNFNDFLVNWGDENQKILLTYLWEKTSDWLSVFFWHTHFNKEVCFSDMFIVKAR
jgi:hypothetical protein